MEPADAETATTTTDVNGEGMVEGEHGDETLDPAREDPHTAGVVDESMIGDAVSVGGHFDGVLFEVLDGGAYAKVALTAPDGAFLDLDLFTSVSKLRLASDPFAMESTGADATDQSGTAPISPGSPNGGDVDLVVEAVRQEFSTLLANMSTVLKQSRAVATYAKFRRVQACCACVNHATPVSTHSLCGLQVPRRSNSAIRHATTFEPH